MQKRSVVAVVAVVVVAGTAAYFVLGRSQPAPPIAVPPPQPAVSVTAPSHPLPVQLEAALLAKVLPQLAKLERPLDVLLVRSAGDERWASDMEAACLALRLRVAVVGPDAVRQRLGEAAAVYAMEAVQGTGPGVAWLTTNTRLVEDGQFTAGFGVKDQHPEIVLSRRAAAAHGINVPPALASLARVVD